MSRLSWLTRLRRGDLMLLAWLTALIACVAPSLSADQPETRVRRPEMAPTVEKGTVEKGTVTEDKIEEDRGPAAEAGDWMSQLSGSAVPERGPSEHSRNHSSVLRAFRDVVGLSAKCTVRIICHDKQVALGTIFDADGLIATKGSELSGPVQCELADGTRCAAELLGVDRGSDLAVLKIPVQGLPAIRWREDDPPAVGSWVVTPGLGALPEAVGIVSVAPHQVRGAILGIRAHRGQTGAAH